MATALKSQSIASNDIVSTVTQNPGIVLLDREKFDAWYEKLSAKAPTNVDVATKKGRDELRSFAAEVRSEKAAIDKARLRLTKEWRDMTAQANEAGKEIEKRLETLAVEVRKPLTDWEEAEAARVERCRAVIDGLKAMALVELDDTAAMVRERGTVAWKTTLDANIFGDMLPEAEAAKATTVETLKRALDRLTKEEADKVELERLRAEAEARAEADRLAEERAEAERQETARKDAERIAAEQAKERERAEEEAATARIEQARKDAAEAAQREAEQEKEAAEAKRRYARQIIDHIKEVGLGMIGGQTYPYGVLLHELEEKIIINDDLGDMQDEVRTIRDATLVNVKAAMERAQERAAREEREAEQRQLAEKQAEREANRAHRTRVQRTAKEAIMTCGADEDTARKIVLAIIAGEVPAVTLRF